MKFYNSSTGPRTTSTRKCAIAPYQDQLVSLLWTRPVQLSLQIAKVTL